MFFPSWLFHGAGFSGCPKGRRVAIAGPPVGPLPPPQQPLQGGVERGPLEATQSTVNSQGSCFLSCCHFTVSVGRAVGQSPRPLFVPSVGNENRRDVPR